MAAFTFSSISFLTTISEITTLASELSSNSLARLMMFSATRTGSVLVRKSFGSDVENNLVWRLVQSRLHVVTHITGGSAWKGFYYHSSAHYFTQFWSLYIFVIF